MSSPVGSDSRAVRPPRCSTSSSVHASHFDEERPRHDEGDPGDHGAGQWLTEEKP